MYVLEIETRDKLVKVKNPRKARVKDLIFIDIIQVMDNDGIWYTIDHASLGVMYRRDVVTQINDAIKQQKECVYIDV